MNPTVVILLSDKRSGSTIFQKEICSHPQIQTVAYSTHRYLETQHWLKAATLLDMPRQTYQGGTVYGAFKNKKNTRAQTIDTIKGNVADYAVPDNDRDLVFEGWELLCKKFSQPVFFEKSPQHLAHWASISLILEWMEHTKFDVKIIGLVRNPMSVQYSAHTLFRTDPEVRQYGWADTYRNLLALENILPAKSYLRVKYEDLVADSSGVFKEVFDFVGVEEYFYSGSEVHQQSSKRWVDDSLFTLRLHDSVRQVAYQFGYSDEEMANPDKPGRTKSQRLITFIANTYKTNRHRIVERVVKPLILRLNQRKS